jgi:hypothetical protein
MCHQIKDSSSSSQTRRLSPPFFSRDEKITVQLVDGVCGAAAVVVFSSAPTIAVREGESEPDAGAQPVDSWAALQLLARKRR